MAEVIESLGGVGRIETYPWGDWMDGRARKAVGGTDYHCKDSSFRQRLYQKSREAGLKVTVRVQPGAVLFQFSRPD
jgi:hypothetical protein